MHVEQIESWPKSNGILDPWNAWADNNPMLSPAWLKNWWESVAATDPRNRLFLVGAFSQGELIGLAPWYVSQTLSDGCCIRFLGDGRTCSDHQSLICAPPNQEVVATAIGRWLSSENVTKKWDSLRFEAIDHHDPAIGCLLECLADRGYASCSIEADGSWYVLLPKTWDEYLEGLSKNHRKRCRRWYRRFVVSGRAELATASSPHEFQSFLAILHQLHNARRNGLGQSGFFECEQQRTFLDAACMELQHAGKAQISILQIDGQPAAAELLLLNPDRVFAYQSGLSAEHLEIGAGNISIMLAIKAAIESGYQVFDFLRGSEAYKTSWGALPCPSHDITVFSNNISGTIRQTLHGSKHWLRSIASVALPT